MRFSDRPFSAFIQISDHNFHPPLPKIAPSEISTRYEHASEHEAGPSSQALQVVVPSESPGISRYGGGTPLKIHIPEGGGHVGHSSAALLPGPSTYGNPYPSPNGMIRYCSKKGFYSRGLAMRTIEGERDMTKCINALLSTRTIILKGCLSSPILNIGLFPNALI